MRTLGKFLAILGLVLLFLYWPAGLFCILIGLVMFAIGKPNLTIEAKKRKGQERPCPFCKEPILKNAIKCKHCQSDIPAEKEIENGLWECKNCHVKMLLAEKFCSKCGAHKKWVAIRK